MVSLKTTTARPEDNKKETTRAEDEATSTVRAESDVTTPAIDIDGEKVEDLTNPKTQVTTVMTHSQSDSITVMVGTESNSEMTTAKSALESSTTVKSEVEKATDLPEDAAVRADVEVGSEEGESETTTAKVDAEIEEEEENDMTENAQGTTKRTNAEEDAVEDGEGRSMLEGTSSLKPAPDDPELEKAAMRWAGYEHKIKRAMKGRKGKEKGQNEDDQEFMDIVQKVDHMDKEKMTAFIIQVPGMSTNQSKEDMREILIEHLYRMKLLQHLDKEDEEKGVIFKPDWTKSKKKQKKKLKLKEEKKSWEKGIKKKGWLGVPDLRKVKKEEMQWEKLKEWDLREGFSQTDGDKIFASKEVDKIINERQWSELWQHPINYGNNLWETIPGVMVRQQGEWDPMDHLRFSQKMKRLWMLNEWSPERRNEEVVQAQTANSEQEEGVEESKRRKKKVFPSAMMMGIQNRRLAKLGLDEKQIDQIQKWMNKQEGKIIIIYKYKKYKKNKDI